MAASSTSSLLDIGSPLSPEESTGEASEFGSEQVTSSYVPPPENPVSDESFCRLGVTLPVLDKLCGLVQQLCDQQRQEAAASPEESETVSLTTTDVSQLLVKPLTEAKQCSLLDLLLDEDAALLKEWGGAVGPATIFVSHAWRYDFLEMADSIRSFAEQLGDDFQRDSTFFWVDIVVNSQWQCDQRPFEWWSTTFRENIRSIGHTLLILSPWNAPIPLTRAWCLYELLSTAVTRAKLSIQLPRAERGAFETALADSFESVMDALANIDAEQSEAWNPTDKEMIFTAVRSYEGGFHELNSTVLDQLRLWLTTTANKAVEARGGMDKASDMGSAKLLDGLAKLYYSLSNFTLARQCQLSALRIKQQLLQQLLEQPQQQQQQQQLEEQEQLEQQPANGDCLGHEEEIYKSKTWLGIITWRSGSSSEALELHQECLEWRSSRLGTEHPQTLQSAGLVANSMRSLRRLSEAESRYRANLEAQTRLFGADNTDTLYSHAWLAVVLQNQKKYAEAAQAHQEVYDIRCRVLGPRHYDTLFSLNNLAIVREKMGMCAEAAELHRTCFAIRHQTLGAFHTSTVSSLTSVVGLYVRQKKYALADALLRPYQQRAPETSEGAVFVAKGLVGLVRLRQSGDDGGMLQEALECLVGQHKLPADNHLVKQLAYWGRPKRAAAATTTTTTTTTDSPARRGRGGGDAGDGKKRGTPRGKGGRGSGKTSDGFKAQGHGAAVTNARASRGRGSPGAVRGRGKAAPVSNNVFDMLADSDEEEEE